MSRHPPVPDETSRATATPAWDPVKPDLDLDEATTEDPSLASWMESLASQGQAAIEDNNEEQLYSQAPDALRQSGIDPTPDAIEAWVTEQVRRARP